LSFPIDLIFLGHFSWYFFD